MTVNVLGPLSLDGERERLTPRDRVVLAALSMRPGEVVSADQLAEALWGDEPPASRSKVVQGCVVRLRKVLGTEAIRTTRQGYALGLPEDAVDGHRFERLLRRGRELLALGEPERARYAFRQALDLWYGAALTDLDGWPPAEAVATRWAEQRLDAEELAVEASLRAGAWQDVLTEAGRLVVDQPFREGRWALLARAQYQGGRQAEALATLKRARAVLVGELGLDPGPDLAAVEEAILRQDAGLTPGPAGAAASTACPYRGLLFYDVDDAEQYFGRDAALQSCLRVLARQRVVAVVGASGSGKSSLVRAGVAAALRQEGRQVVVLTPGARPMSALTEVGGLRPRVTLVVDQLEEAVTLCQDPSERRRFLDALAGHEDAGADLVLALRADRLGVLSQHRGFARLLERELHLLSAMDEEALRTAIEGPARQAGLLLEPGLVDVLVHEVASEPGALPLLSHALAQTWERREGRTLTVEGYRASGGIQGAVAQTAEQVYVDLSPTEQDTARDLLLRLVVPAGEGEATRAPVPRRTAAPDAARERVIEKLVAARLVTSDADTVALAHESLIRAWPRLRAWLDADAEGQLILRHLTLAADSWETMGRPDSELYRGPRLARAREWRAGTDALLTETEIAFLDAAERLADEESRSAERRLAEQARSNRRLRTLLGGVVALLLVALVAGTQAVKQESRADEQARLAMVRELAAAARAAGTEDPELALLLALEASSPDLNGGGAVPREAVEALHTAVVSSRSDYATREGGGPVAWSGSGDLIATAASAGSGLVELRDATNGEPVARLAGHDGGTHSVAFGPGGSVATSGEDGFLRVWSAEETEMLAEIEGDGLGGPALGVSVAASGPMRVAAAWPADARVRIATFAGSPAGPGSPEVTEIPVSTWPEATSLSPDGTSVAVSTPFAEESVVADVETGSTRYRLRGHEADAYLTDVAYSPDGRWLASADDDGTVVVLEAETGRVVHTVSDAVSGILELAWAPDSRRLASAGYDGAIRVHEVTEDRARAVLEIGSPSAGGGVEGLAFSPDGARLLSGSLRRNGSTVWNVGRGGDAEIMNVPVPRDSAGAAFGPDGLLYAPGKHGSVRVWRQGRDGPVARLAAPEDFERNLRPTRLGAGAEAPLTPPPRRVVVSGDGALVGTGETPAGAIVWSTQSDGLVHSGPPRWSWRPAFSPDGRLMALAGDGFVSVRTLDGAVVARRSTREYELGDPVFRPGGRSLAYVRYSREGGLDPAGEDVMLWNWDVDTVREVSAGRGQSPAFSPDGQRLAVADVGSPPRVVDVDSGEVLFRLEGHVAGVADVTYSPDGSMIATAGYDGVVMVWRAFDGSLLQRLPALPREASSVAFSHDGRYLATGSITEEVVRVWTLDVEELRRLAADKVTRGFTEAECERYLQRRDCAAAGDRS